MIVLSVNFVVYVSASESGIMYTAVIHCSDEILAACRQELHNVAHTAVSWAHTEDPVIPLFCDEDSKNSIKERLPFFPLVQTHVKEWGPFPPLKLFKHASQSLYSKTKGGMDGSAQHRAILRSSVSAFKWEQKLVSQTLKTLCINAFIAWRMKEKEALLETEASFGNIDKFRTALNCLQSLADFVHDVSKELIAYADKLEKEDTAIAIDERPNESDLSRMEIIRLKTLAASRQRKRLIFFNSENGIKLRLAVGGHEQRQRSKEKYCVLCGKNQGVWRGHRSSFKCSQCDVHLCVRTHVGLHKSCWDVFHSSKKLSARHTVRPESHVTASSNRDAVNSSQHDSSRIGIIEETGGQQRPQNSSNGQQKHGTRPNLRRSARRQRADPSTPPARKRRRAR